MKPHQGVTEKKLFVFLEKLACHVRYGIHFKWSKSPRSKVLLEYDFVLPEDRTIIELDGPQHFRQVSNWKSPRFRRVMDVFKMLKAVRQGYSVIRISQPDVACDSFDWQSELVQAINNKHMVQYIAKDRSLYDHHNKLFEKMMKMPGYA